MSVFVKRWRSCEPCHCSENAAAFAAICKCQAGDSDDCPLPPPSSSPPTHTVDEAEARIFALTCRRGLPACPPSSPKAVATWLWMGSGDFQPYDASTSRRIDEAYRQGRREVRIHVAGSDYVVDFHKMRQASCRQLHGILPCEPQLGRSTHATSGRAGRCAAEPTCRLGPAIWQVPVVSCKLHLPMQVPVVSPSSRELAQRAGLQAGT